LGLNREPLGFEVPGLNRELSPLEFFQLWFSTLHSSHVLLIQLCFIF
jgi:hypothetical protein